MRQAPRNATLALALALACGTAARAQTPPADPRAQGGAAAQTPKAARGAKAAEAKARAQRTRRRAVAVLLEVAAGAKEIEDAYRRASVLAVCADALWESDEQAARSAFRRAWDAAVASDEEEFEEEQEQGRYGDLPERFTRAREMTLAAAARRDTRMADAWLGALAEWLSRHEGGARGEGAARDEAGRDAGPPNEFTREGRRLALASTLMGEKEYAAAARVVAPSLRGGVSGPLVEFLLNLRRGAPEEADRLYLQLLAGARADADADANDVLLLSSYVLAPRLLTVVGDDGSLRFRSLGGAAGAAPGAQAPASSARAAFFDAAAAILLRPARPAGANAADAAALYFTTGRLLPFFERESPRHAAALRARLAETAAALDAARRTALDSQMETRSLSPENPSDPLQSWLDAAQRADDPALRDRARLNAVEAAAKKRLWERARGLAEEVEGEERRREARAVIAAHQLASAPEAFEGDEDDFERAAALARDADVTPALRAYGLAAAAEFASKRGRAERAELLLGEALVQASQAQAGTSLRDAAAMLTATAAARTGSPRAWEALAAAVASLNEDEEFDGEPIWFNLETRVSFSRGETEALNSALQPFTVDVMFDAAARRDFERAAAEARNLKSPSARSRSLVAAARAALAQTAPRAAP